MSDAVCTPNIPITRVIDGYTFVLQSIHVETIKLKDRQLADYEKALEFYGKSNNWNQLDEKGCYRKEGEGIFYLGDRNDMYLATDSGKHAREVLAKYKGGQ